MAAIPGSVPVAGFIAPTDSTDTFAAIDPLWGIDGYRSVADHATRNAIVDGRRRYGMLCFTQNDDKIWRLKASPWAGDDTDWVEFTGGGGGGSPSSPDTSVQFNDSSSFGGSADFTWDTLGLSVLRHAAIGNAGVVDTYYPCIINEIVPDVDTGVTGLYVNIEHNPPTIGSVLGLEVSIATTTGVHLPQAMAIRASTTLTSGVVDSAAGFHVNQPYLVGATVGIFYGLLIDDLTDAGTNYAIYTGEGLLQFGPNFYYEPGNFGEIDDEFEFSNNMFFSGGVADFYGDQVWIEAGTPLLVGDTSEFDGVATFLDQVIAGTPQAALPGNLTSYFTLSDLAALVATDAHRIGLGVLVSHLGAEADGIQVVVEGDGCFPLTLESYMHVGGHGLEVVNNVIGGSSHILGVLVSTNVTGGATPIDVTGLTIDPVVVDASGVGNVRGVYIAAPTTTGGGSIGTCYGLIIEDQVATTFDSAAIITGLGYVQFGDTTYIIADGPDGANKYGLQVGLSTSGSGNQAFGIESGIYTADDSTGSEHTAMRLLASVAGGAVCTEIFDIDIRPTTIGSGATVGSIYGARIDVQTNNLLGGATLTNAYGIKIQDVGTKATNNWAIKTGSGLIDFGDNVLLTGGHYIEGTEQSAPAAPPANGYRIFAQDNGSGKTKLMVIFASGAAQQLAIQP